MKAIEETVEANISSPFEIKEKKGLSVIFKSMSGKKGGTVSKDFEYDTCRYDSYFDFRKGAG